MIRGLCISICILSGCSPHSGKTTVVPISTPNGIYKADDIIIANGIFLPYKEERPYAEFSPAKDTLTVSLSIPTKGDVSLHCTAVVPRSSFHSSWEGKLDEYDAHIDMDFHRRVFVIIGDGGEDGTSNSIGWRFDLPYGNG